MNRRRFAQAAMISLLTALPSRGESAPAGLSFGVRSGAALPIGVDLESFSAMVPSWFDLGYRFSPNFYLGAYFQYGVAFSRGCPRNFSCSANDVRVGFNAHYHLIPESTFDPWVGIGTGYESAHSTVVINGERGSGETNGFELVNFQLGADFSISKRLKLGPFAALTTSMFFWADGEQISLPQIHDWIVVGLRGRFDL